MSNDQTTANDWPPIPFSEWQTTAAALHLFLQIAGTFCPLPLADAESDTGQFPLMTYHDSNGDILNGSDTYPFRMRPDVPVAPKGRSA